MLDISSALLLVSPTAEAIEVRGERREVNGEGEAYIWTAQ
jgi:hypothetical protein